MNMTFFPCSPDDLRQLIREEVAKVFCSPATNAAEQTPYLTINQAADRHGVSKSYLYRLSSDRAISTRRVGKSIQFDAKELEDHFNKTAKRSQAAIDADLKKNGVFPTLKGKHNV